MSYFDNSDNEDNDGEYMGGDGSDDEGSVAPTLKRSKPTLIVEGEDSDVEDEAIASDEEDEEAIIPNDENDEDIDIASEVGEGEDEDDESYLDGEIEEKPITNKKLKDLPKNLVYNIGADDEEQDTDDEDDDGEQYLQKFSKEVNKNYIMDFHPECVLHNYEEISAMTNVVRDKNNVIIDPLHKTIPFLTKYEKARILGQRAKQINSGATPFVKVPENVIDGYLIAELELAEKRIPFIIRRPLPNGGSEYWNIKDLEIVGF